MAPKYKARTKHIRDLIHDEKEEIYEWLSGRDKINVMDIGCGFPANLILCYYNFNTNLLVGIDESRSEKEMNLFHIERTELSNLPERSKSKIDNFFRLHNKIFIDKKPNGKIKLDKIKFEEKIMSRIKLDQKIENYEFEGDEKFDLIIAYNMLHFIRETSKLEEIIAKIQKWLKPDGRIVFKVVEERFTDQKWTIQQFKSSMQKYYTKLEFIEMPKTTTKYKGCYCTNFLNPWRNENQE